MKLRFYCLQLHLLSDFQQKVYCMNCKVWKYKFFPAEVSDLFATVAKDLYQINPGQNTLFFSRQNRLCFSMHPPIFFGNWHLQVVAKCLLIYINFINTHDKLFPVMLHFLEGLPTSSNCLCAWKVYCRLCVYMKVNNLHIYCLWFVC